MVCKNCLYIVLTLFYIFYSGSFGLTLEEKLKFSIYEYLKDNYPFIKDIDINLFIYDKNFNNCSLERINLDNLKPGRSSLIVKVICNEQRAKYIKVLTYIDGSINVFQAKRRILRNEKFIIGNNIENKEVKLSELLNNKPFRWINKYIIDEIEKFSSKTVIEKQSIINIDKIKKNIAINAGDIINLILKHKNIEISTKAIALENASVGDTIKVRIISTQKILKGIVKNEETVEINY